jgi:predicted RNA-binding Zn ribbon-like protein
LPSRICVFGEGMTALRDPRPAPFFIGDHLALDFLNTKAAPSGAWIEWLANGADLVDWLKRAGAIDRAVAANFLADANALRRLDVVTEQARDLREWLRGFLGRHTGKVLKASALSELEPLNRLLARDEIYRQVVSAATRASAKPSGTHQALLWSQRRHWTSPELLLQPIAEAIGDLICNVDFRLIRTCEGPTCTLMFYDRTKGHARRWCSMSVCGNRAKAAAHRARVRKAKRAPRT